jgi:hypothetical protein
MESARADEPSCAISPAQDRLAALLDQKIDAVICLARLYLAEQQAFAGPIPLS